MKQLIESWKRYLNEEVGKPKLVFLIGPPAVGKSWWVKKNVSNEFVILNRDDVVNKVAAESGVGGYDDMYKRPPKEILPLPMPEPKDPQKVEQYLNSLQAVADKFNQTHKEETQQFGPVAPFSVEDYIKALTPRTEGGWGVPVKFFVPLYYPKINDANEAIKAEFEAARDNVAKGKKNVIIDMTNMSQDERDGHRIRMASAINNIEPKDISKEEAIKIINDKFEQEAYIFANNSEGWSEEEKKEIVQVSSTREDKTIPPDAYARIFDQYNIPTKAEGYSLIKLVGIPSLKRS